MLSVMTEATSGLAATCHYKSADTEGFTRNIGIGLGMRCRADPADAASVHGPELLRQCNEQNYGNRSLFNEVG